MVWMFGRSVGRSDLLAGVVSLHGMTFKCIFRLPTSVSSELGRHYINVNHFKALTNFKFASTKKDQPKHKLINERYRKFRYFCLLIWVSLLASAAYHYWKLCLSGLREPWPKAFLSGSVLLHNVVFVYLGKITPRYTIWVHLTRPNSCLPSIQTCKRLIWLHTRGINGLLLHTREC